MEVSINELRIGGIFTHFGFIQKIDAIYPKNKLTDKHRRIEFESGVTSFAMNLKPILIDDEWMFRFGFDKIEFDSEEEGFGTEYHLEVCESVYLVFCDDFSLGIYCNKPSINPAHAVIPEWKQTIYVHQLQNLYYSLLGKELPIELTPEEIDRINNSNLKNKNV